MPNPGKLNPRILIFGGSMRAGSLHRKLARAAAGALQNAGAEATYIELKDYPMPIYDGDLESSMGIPAPAIALGALMRRHDALAIASPEYNGSFSPLVKNMIDWISRPHPGERHSSAFRGKTAGLLSASPGPGGGARGLRHLREVLENVGVAVIPDQVVVPRALEAFDSHRMLVRAGDVQTMQHWAEQLTVSAAARMRTAA